MLKSLFHWVWIGWTVATVAVYLLPVPMRGTLLLAIGFGHGVLFSQQFSFFRDFSLAKLWSAKP
jgi:hypothetical protein